MQPRHNFSGSKIRIWDALDETIGQWVARELGCPCQGGHEVRHSRKCPVWGPDFPKGRCDRQVKVKKRIPTRRILHNPFRPMSKHGWGPCCSYRASTQLAEVGPVLRTFCQHDSQSNRTLAHGGDGFQQSRDAPARACSSCPRPSATFASICLKPEDSPLDVGCRAGLGSSRRPGPWPATPGPVCRRGLDRLKTGNEWQRKLDSFRGRGQDTTSQRIQPVEVPNMRR
ncbi:hypothetical protein F5144DRAFT_594167 [Chaetomium tenue]|uniref:Uncharacterized protein n=1 Tax=Chaetomium tenue TaxID=1854479 RepID=A0ACB7P2B9_9PEZI|nr:hypothetical protein F5144DRAFT_594167 [Chaetomium globosum]